MPPKSHDAASLYHLNSNNLRAKQADLRVDRDGKPERLRTFPGSTRISLPGRDFQLSATLGSVLEQRRSIRDFTGREVSSYDFGRLLHCAYGIHGQREIENEWANARPCPSGGGLYPLELYVAAQRVEGVADGIYHYDASAHELELRKLGKFHDQIADLTIGQTMVSQANLVIMISAVFERTMWKYGERGYRYVWLEAGHVGQNLYLIATALGLGAVAIGGFFDAEANHLAELPADEQFIYMVCIGSCIPYNSAP